MNEKQLNQIDAWLQGQHRYKLLDCEQTAFLKLKGSLLQVWMACYLHENDDQESWLSNAAIMRETGIASEHTVIEARRWLVANGWLKETGHVAAIKYLNPSQGSYKVPCITVDNPAKNAGAANYAAPSRKRAAKIASAKIAEPPAKSADKGSVSVSGSGSLSDSKESESIPVSVAEDSESMLSASLAIGEERVASLLAPSGGDENQKPKTRASAVKWLQKYAAPKPDEFDTWSVSARAIWIEANRLRPGQPPAVPVPSEDRLNAAPDVRESAPPTPPPGSAPPPARFKFNCPVCEFGHKYGYEVAEHIEKEHPHLGQQTFEIICPNDECQWVTGWNKVSNNKDDKDAALLEHLEVQHDPKSSRYDPWEPCKCGVYVRRSDREEHHCKEAA